MEERRSRKLQDILRRLGRAVHGSVVNSDEVQMCLRELHENRWDAVMLLEASVACKDEGTTARRRRRSTSTPAASLPG